MKGLSKPLFLSFTLSFSFLFFPLSYILSLSEVMHLEHTLKQVAG